MSAMILHSLVASLLVVYLVKLFFNSLKNVQYFFTISIYIGHEKKQQFCMRTDNITDQTVGNMPTYICQIINLIPDGPNRTPERQKRFHWLDIFCWANGWNIKLILILQAFLIFFQGLVVSKLSFSSIMLVFVFQIKLNKNLNSQLLSHHSILSHTFEL